MIKYELDFIYIVSSGFFLYALLPCISLHDNVLKSPAATPHQCYFHLSLLGCKRSACLTSGMHLIITQERSSVQSSLLSLVPTNMLRNWLDKSFLRRCTYLHVSVARQSFHWLSVRPSQIIIVCGLGLGEVMVALMQCNVYVKDSPSMLKN